MQPTVDRVLGRGDGLLDASRARAAALASADHPGVVVPLGVANGPDGVVIARFPVVPGASLAEATQTRRLSLGEVVTVAIGAADALAAMHRVHVAHGDLSAANVMVRGREVSLVDTLGVVEGDASTLAYAAPERAAGPTPAADVYALGALLREIADDAAAPAVEAWTEPMVRIDPATRPPAHEVAIAFTRCGAALPVEAPTAPVVDAMRAGAAERTVRLASGRVWRLERAAVHTAPLIAMVAIAVPVALTLIPDARAAARAPEAILQATHAAVTQAEPTLAAHAPGQTVVIPEDPVHAAVYLTESRVAALASADPVALEEVTLPGSPAAHQDAETAAKLASGELAFVGLNPPRVSASLVEATTDGAVVEIVTESAAYEVRTAGEQTQMPAAITHAVLELRLTQQGWRVERVRLPE